MTSFRIRPRTLLETQSMLSLTPRRVRVDSWFLADPNQDERSDRELLDAWAGGDEDAGNLLVRRHFPMVYRFFRSKVPDTAEDLAQATFLACVEGRERFRGDSTFKSYVLGIARYQLLYHFRKRRRDFDVMEMGHRSVADLGKSPSRVVAESEEQAILFEALHQIPIDYQIALELYYWEDMTQGEVAAVLGVKEGTAKSRLNHARELVREQLRTMKIPEQLRQSTLAQIERIQRDLGRTLGSKKA